MADENKLFCTLAALYAMAGFALIRAKPGDGSAPFYLSRWGYLRPMHSLEEASQFLEQVQGARHE